MPSFRLVFVRDELGLPETLTAGFADCAAVVAAVTAGGARVLHVAELRRGETPSAPVMVPIAAAAAAPERVVLPAFAAQGAD